MLALGQLAVPVPVFLAPMAGVTNPAYRRLCREQAEAATPARPAGIFTCEMITAQALAHRVGKTLAMMAPDPGDPVYSVQLYGTDPAVIAQAVAIACGERGVTHIDLNFGCPVPKVTRRGGGGALPWKLDRLAAILAGAVQAAQPYQVPVTIKTRLGIDQDHLTMVDAGRIAEDCGVAAVTLHARTVDQAYAGQADWAAIAELVQIVGIPVIGNGDIWEADDALAMRRATGCAGVSVGRGALGRPWIFADLAGALGGGSTRGTTLPTLGQVAAMVRRHGELLVEHVGDEPHAMADLRKHMAWYFKGFTVGPALRAALGLVSSLAQLDALLGELDLAEPFPRRQLHAPRGRQGSPRAKVALPYGWLNSRQLDPSEPLDPDGALLGQAVAGG
jgi:nifR3 family TIM-barrel protein